MQAELLHHLRLSINSIEGLWKYHLALSCISLEDKLLVLVSVPLLDRDSTFEIYQVINMPIPYPWVEQELGVIVIEWKQNS